MKIRILTAHGYLSFQPVGPGEAVTVQYRPTPGPWEEFDVDGLEEIIIPPPVEPEESDYPFGIIPSETSSYVQQIKDALVFAGVNLSGPCGAFEICRNVALGLREVGCGLLFKDTGNMCQERSTDIVCYKDFSQGATRLVDILGDAGGENNCMWTEKGPEENVEMERWCDPTLSTPTSGSQSVSRSRK